jgi:DNA-directed RNA polymerase specialized sigma24 family protein
MRTSGNPGPAPGSLGAVLYRPDLAAPLVMEDEWVKLVRRVVARDESALHGLYERASRFVYALAFRIVGSSTAAEDVTAEVFEDVWRRAWAYQPDSGSVLAWIMNQARTRARERTRSIGSSPSSGAEALEALRPGAALQSRLARRIANLARSEPSPPPLSQWQEPAWTQVAPAIKCKLLANDSERHRVSMLVQLEPGGDYPPHTHAGLEELHLLEGELWINGRKLVPGDYNRAESGSSDLSVRTDTGCTCLLVTSSNDVLR